ncbi:hypothetical protein SAMN05421874_128117 [Nonomuraea maritima]|uniref:Uncharacterized protein n=1 Tax=Nonomuraea maritima TaxID=683260 RepID=A0A1G9MNL0_9ACTN|nr:hypothetical protein [Nonomuraea maritima]SDL75830.1 hypothetical protein SAMN05421874_128117 [Nonomuraea maritima]
MTLKSRRRRTRPRASWTEAEKQVWRESKDADKKIVSDAVVMGARALSQRPDLIDAFREYAARVQGHRTLRNALAMLAQNPNATRVNSAFFWAKEDRAVLKTAEPMRVIARRRGGKKVEEFENKETGQTEEVDAGEWSGFTSERVFDVRDTVPKNRPCDHCGTHVGLRCPETCAVYEVVRGPAPTRDEVRELLDRVLKDDIGFFPADVDGEGEDSEQ